MYIVVLKGTEVHGFIVHAVQSNGWSLEQVHFHDFEQNSLFNFSNRQ